MPTASARIPLFGEVSIPSRMSTPVGSESHFQPKEMPDLLKFLNAWVPRTTKIATTATRATICASHLRKVAFRQRGVFWCSRVWTVKPRRLPPPVPIPAPPTPAAL